MAVTDDLADNTLAVVLAGGNGTRLDPLTRHICKPALPFGGGFRSIDFTLSNCVNSGVRTIGVATQYKPAALLAHLAGTWNGAPGDSVVVPWPADERAPNGGYGGTADAVYRNLELIDDFDPRLVLILAGDHVYKMDYRPMLEEHCARGADVTVGCVDVAAEDARHFGVLAVGEDRCIERFIEKPQSKTELPRPDDDAVLASMGIYVFNADFLARVLTQDAFTPRSRHDFGADIFPKLIRNTRVFAHAFRGADGSTAPYWRDIGTLRAYWQAHMDLLGPTPVLALDDTTWPVGTAAKAPQRISSATVTARGGTLENSIVGAGCAVAGQVRRSVLFDGVEIGRGATVGDSVVLPGARIGAGSRLRGVIVDTGSSVPDGAVLERTATGTEPLVLSAHRVHEETIRYALAG
jgi:glucose-1-phosphate adenylyltransferase